MKQIYLDYAAASPMDPSVLAVMQPYFARAFYNPSATYLAARQVKANIAEARARVAHWFGAKPAEIIFTAGGTEANNLAIHGIMQQYPQANVVVSSIEHESVLAPAKQYACKEVGVEPDGRLNRAELKTVIDDKTVLVSIMYANNEVGTIQPLKEVATLVAEIRNGRQKSGNSLPLFLHTDACQAPAYLAIHAARLGVDLMTINAGKIYGPKQCGALYASARVRLQPQILGGGQERGLRSGTENVANITGLATALDLVQNRRQQETPRLQTLQAYFIKQLQKALPQVIINGSLKHRLPNNVHLTIPGADNERLIMELDERGILCAAGSACSASDEEPSHVLKAMGLPDADTQASLRFSFGHQTTKADIEKTVRVLHQLTRR
ncbi:MAG: Aminotransferase [Candidatus Saccharibacteria bacterium]|nr:Aminotransferase [Candidatus Saccharibacteria bacterium]